MSMECPMLPEQPFAYAVDIIGHAPCTAMVASGEMCVVDVAATLEHVRDLLAADSFGRFKRPTHDI